jgi:SAM-dependent methyltransferase
LAPVDFDQPVTVWEVVAARTRWGRYITEVVEEFVVTAARMAGRPGSAFEIGCEGGRWSRLLARLGWSMTCTDIDPEALSVCRHRVPGANCILVSPSDTSLRSATGAVNLLVCVEVFPVMESEWFPHEANRVLADDGVLVGVVQNRFSLRGLFVHVKQSVQSSEKRFYNLSYSQWRRRMADAGFDISLERGYCWFPFTRESDSILAPFFVKIERWLGLGALTAFSPWIVFVARKRQSATRG